MCLTLVLFRGWRRKRRKRFCSKFDLGKMQHFDVPCVPWLYFSLSPYFELLCLEKKCWKEKS